MPVKYLPFYPDPIEGQALLDNFKRTLKYQGSDELGQRLRRGMPLYEVETIERVGADQSDNMLIRGECVSACAYLKNEGIEVDLVYIDPPFASGADYAKKVYLRRNPKVAEAIEKAEAELAEAELDNGDLQAFEETMYGDVWDKEKYLNWMYENLMAIKSVMSETASIYVHLDWHIGHYVKILLDEIFGEDNFLNELVWVYKERETSTRSYNRKHDNIYYYVVNSANDDYIFNSEDIRETYSEITKKKFKFTDAEGRKYRLRGKDGTNDPREESESTYRQYIDEASGPLPRDWFEMAFVNQAANERCEYATQKPEALLERIIKASSDAGMLVADFFGGSGTTAAVAHKLGRKFIHCDVGLNSIQTARDRLKESNADFEVLEIKDGVSLYRNPKQTMDKLKSLIPGLVNDDALDSFWEGTFNDSKLGLVPVYIPNLMDSTTRVLDEAPVNRIIKEALPDVPDTVKKVVVFYIDVDDLSAIQKFIKDNNDSKVQEIELRDLKEVLDDVVVEDYASFKLAPTTETLMGGWELSLSSFTSDRVTQKLDEYNQKGQLNIKNGKVFTPITVSETGLELIEYLSLDCQNSERDAVWHSDSEVLIEKFGKTTINGTKTKEYWNGTISSEEKPKRLKVRNICGDETVWVIEELDEDGADK